MHGQLSSPCMQSGTLRPLLLHLHGARRQLLHMRCNLSASRLALFTLACSSVCVARSIQFFSILD